MTKYLLQFFSLLLVPILFSACSSYTGDLKLNMRDPSRRTLIVSSSSIVGPRESYKTVVVLSGDLDFSGRADDLVVLSGNLHLRVGSRIENTLVILSGNLQKDNGAFVQGDEIQFHAPDFIPPFFLGLAPYIGFAASGVALVVSTIFWILIHWLGGAFSYLTMPKFMAEIELLMREEKPRNFFASFLAVLLTVPSILLLVLSLIGILFLPIYGMLYAMILGLAYIVFASVLGQWLPPKRTKKYSPLRLLFGLSVISLMRLIFPFLSSIIVTLGIFLAWGAVLRVSYRRIFPRKKASA